MQPLVDCHVHSTFSVDGELTMKEACQEATERGLVEIAFTEHFDCDPHDHGTGFFRPDDYMMEIAACRKAYHGLLTIRTGIEVSEPHLYRNEIESILLGRRFDLVIGAVHWVAGRSPTTSSYFVGKSEKEAYNPYFDKVYEMASTGSFDGSPTSTCRKGRLPNLMAPSTQGGMRRSSEPF